MFLWTAVFTVSINDRLTLNFVCFVFCLLVCFEQPMIYFCCLEVPVYFGELISLL